MRIVLSNALWIAGLALLLAAFSYQYYEATLQGRALKEQLSESSFVLVAWIAATLVTAGLAATSDAVWEAILWLLFTAYCAANAFVTYKQRQSQAP